MVFLSRRSHDDCAEAASHPMFAATLERVPGRTRWAVSCRAEFRVRGSNDLFGVLHHDGAILRFTTWGGSERFAGAPMEFRWSPLDGGGFRIVNRGHTARFMEFGPLSAVVSPTPDFAAQDDQPLERQLDSWMRSWAPLPAAPLASRM